VSQVTPKACLVLIIRSVSLPCLVIYFPGQYYHLYIAFSLLGSMSDYSMVPLSLGLIAQ
jgi:hypothetical protein